MAINTTVLIVKRLKLLHMQKAIEIEGAIDSYTQHQATAEITSALNDSATS